jgi:hypothetical protein
MPLDTIPLPYGLREIKLTPFTTAAATAYVGASIKLPNAQTMTFTEKEEFSELRGDDQLQATHGQGAQVDFELESGGISFEAYAAMAGGTVNTTGVTPNQVKTYKKNINHQRPYFKVEGRAISDSGGDFHTVIYKAKITGDLKGELKDGEFMIPGASGTGLPSSVVATVGDVYDFIQNETAAAIV